MKLTIFGTGYVGLTAAVCFADKGNDVICVDVDQSKVDKLKNGIPTIYEFGLKDLLEKNADRMTFTTDAKLGTDHAEVIFLAVGTPQKPGSLQADLQYLEAAATTIAKLAKQDKIIVIKSTVPVGTSKHIQSLMQQHTKHKISMVSNPEFLKEGTAIADFESPDRVIIGTDDKHARTIMNELYMPFFRRSDRMLFMSNASAELSKYGANIMLASRIAIMNELARIAETVHADITDVRQGMATDERIGPHFLYAGPGYGGSCFPKDVRELSALAGRLGTRLRVIPAIDESNDEHKHHVSQRVLQELNPTKDKTVAIWGVAFKAKTDDIRDSPSIVLIKQLLGAGVKIRLADPEALENAKHLFGNNVHYGEEYEVLEGADALVIMTDWNEYKTPDFDRIKTLLKQPLIFDGRNLYNLESMQEHGFRYLSVGRKNVN